MPLLRSLENYGNVFLKRCRAYGAGLVVKTKAARYGLIGIGESDFVALMNAEKKSTTEMAKLIKTLTLTINVLDSDVKFAADHWRKEPSNQFWRRTLIRCLSALAEGTLGLLKNITPDSAKFFDVNLTEKDIEIATECRSHTKDGITKTSPKFLPFPENVKETFKVFAKAHAAEVAINCEDQGFRDLCNSSKCEISSCTQKDHSMSK